MPTRVSATTEVALSIHIQCEGCGHEFTVTRSITGYGTSYNPTGMGKPSPQTYSAVSNEAQNMLADRINRLREGKDFSFLKTEPCPECGYIQSYMVTSLKQEGSLYLICGAVFTVILGAITFASYYFGDGLNFVTIGLGLFAILSLVLTLVGLFKSRKNPNRLWLKTHGLESSNAPKPSKPLSVKRLSI